MKLVVSIDGDINELMAGEYRAGERAVSASVRAAAAALKADWRAQVTGAGLGGRLANAIRSDVFPRGKSSLNAAAIVYSKAPKITAAHEEGPLIRAANGIWLAIPLPAAGKGRFGRKLTPAAWEQMTGLELTMVYRPGRSALLVTTGRLSKKKGLARRKGGKRRDDGILPGETTVPIFVLVKQVKLEKRLNLYPAAERIAAGLPSAIVTNWRSE